MKGKLLDKISRLIEWYFSKRAMPYWAILVVDCILIISSGMFAYTLHAGVVRTLPVFWLLLRTQCFYLLVYLMVFRVMRTYLVMLRYSSIVDLWRVGLANTLAAFVILVLRHVTLLDVYFQALPWQALVFSSIISTALMWLLRVGVKYVYDLFYVAPGAQKVFVYGTKGGGMLLAKGLQGGQSRFILAGFVSDDIQDTNILLMGTKIYYNDENLVQKMLNHGVKTLMVSPLKTEVLRDNQAMIDRLAQAHIRIMLYTSEEWDGSSDIHHHHLKDVEVEDLLPRNQIRVDLDAISQIIKNRSVMITGAAGSIGSEIVRQVASFCPSNLLLVDQAETPLHDVRLMMARLFPDIPCQTVTASICHDTYMEHLFKTYNPEYVFHAAAYKHVPMMEDNPGEAVINNIDGTRIVANLAVKYGVKKFVMVSTDKAVNPTNVMGCSKRICEMYCQSLNQALKDGEIKGETQFVTTRFGNVLGSNGSVIPLFKEQLKTGGPLTVTHPDIIRYFMLIPEACKLVLQAGTMGQGGEVFVFDMGKPVRIADLARRMILLSGATNVTIKYTGLRDGEKLYEELLNKEENTKPSSHPKIKLADVPMLSYHDVNEGIDRLVEITKSAYDDMEIVRQMKKMVPEFISKNSKYETLDK